MMAATAECMCNQCVQAAFLLQEHITGRCVSCDPAPFVRGGTCAPRLHKLLCWLCCDWAPTCIWMDADQRGVSPV
jgi:hypothetical protein